MKPSDFRSDTVTQPTAAMRSAMMAAPLGDDVFGDDPSVNALQTQAAELLGFEAALFAPSGTMTNLMALMAHCERGDEAICGQQWHTYRWEAGGMAVLGSIQPQPLANDADGTIPLALIEAAIKPDDAHFARTRIVILENTTGGQVLPLSYVASVGALARSKGLGLHLDGARLFNAATQMASGSQTATGFKDTYAAARALCSHFDSVSLCLSKGLGGPVGSLLLGSSALIARAKRVRKMLGGGMRQAGILAAAGQYALQHHVLRLSDDHARLQTLVLGLAQAAQENAALGPRFVVQSAHTNIAFTDVHAPVAPALLAHLASAGVRVTAGMYAGASRIRWVTHLDVGDADVDRAVAALRSFS